MPPLSIAILRNVSGVGAATLRAFQEAGYHTTADLEGITLDALTQVPGVGAATAQAILDYLASPTLDDPVQTYTHDATRKNIPPAGLASQGKVSDIPATRYFYDPHLPPVLRFDEAGQADRLPELLEKAKREPLTSEEAQMLADALRTQQPWLEWTGKREKRWFDVDPVALHIHERVSAKALIALAQRKPLQASLFADPELDYRATVQFYQHDVNWANRLILGDSLVVMHSLAKREDLAGKVQMIYIDPPYGIKFASNFQPFIGSRDVKDRDKDLTREPEQIKAYRDTWTLGIHSYLTYLRDRIIVARDLLADRGSLFVQISDENVHRLRAILDEIFKPENFISQITFQKTGGISSNLLGSTTDYLIWYAKDKNLVKYRQVFLPRTIGDTSLDRYDQLKLDDGQIRRMTGSELTTGVVPTKAKRYQLFPLYSEGASSEAEDFEFESGNYSLRAGTHWKTTIPGLSRLAKADRIMKMGDVIRYKRFWDDFSAIPLTDRWESTQIGTQRIYVVQTSTTVIERCMLMTTDPGDLVIDPTCGSGTTAYIAEKWGRRWITIDTSRVAIALARQRC